MNKIIPHFIPYPDTRTPTMVRHDRAKQTPDIAIYYAVVLIVFLTLGTILSLI